MKHLKQIQNNIWTLEKGFKKGMNVPARVFANSAILKSLDKGVLEQASNVACMPGIIDASLVMPDAHWGYGFPIGGVAAFDLEHGVISPGGIGFDINCGMRLMRTNLCLDEVKPKIPELMDKIFRQIPSGVGGKGIIKLDKHQFKDVLIRGSAWCIDNDLGWESDLECTEDLGCIKDADPSKVSSQAVQRGFNQVGSLGSGNHYLEIQRVGSILDKDIAKKLGITQTNQIVVMIHCGSRGFGHQVASDYLKLMDESLRKYNIHVKDRQLACAPFKSIEAQNYFSAMACACNMAFANRQIIMHKVRDCFADVFGRTPKELEMSLIYDVTHNIAKVETHEVDGTQKEVLVHRKGATRAFAPGHPDLPHRFQATGQPVIIGGSMETGSYLLTGTQQAMHLTFGSTAHGSGRLMSRAEAKRMVRGNDIQKKMLSNGIVVRSNSLSGLAEEAGLAYKDISSVVSTLESTGISNPVAELKPIGNIKG